LSDIHAIDGDPSQSDAESYVSTIAAPTVGVVGDDPRYSHDSDDANDAIFDHFNATPLYYALDDPHHLKRVLEELMRNLSSRARIVLIPFGPKLFAWIVMLLALEDPKRETAVWRFSPEETAEPIDRKASGKIIRYDFALSSRDP